MENSATNIDNHDSGQRIRIHLIWIIAISTVIRLVLASLLELGNDEVYYWTYAEYPDLSHFDHPPVVGFVIKLFTLNGFLKDDFFLRLGPIVLSAFDTWLLFVIVKKIGNELAGLYAAFLFNSSIYFSIISGFSIVPDAPLVLFWLLSLNMLVDVLPVNNINQKEHRKMISFGVFAGLAMLSKYQGAFIWLGALLYIFLYNRKWLRDYSLFLAVLISLFIVLPIVLWNIQNNFISFSFHGERVTPSFGIRLDYLARELVGQIAYQNPFNIVVFIPVVFAFLKRKPFIDSTWKRMLVLNGLPIWLVFTGFSLFRSTLPHWTGPAFLPVIIMASVYWSKQLKEGKSEWQILRPIKILLPAYFLAGLLVLAVYLIHYSPFHFGRQDNTHFGEDDFTQDLYGWGTLGESFRQLSAREEKEGLMPPHADLISFRWFPGAHIDFYVANPTGRNLFLIGDLSDIHKYALINEQRGGLIEGEDYYYIAPSNYYRDPEIIFGGYFKRIDAIDTVQVLRGGEVMRYAFFYRLKGFKGNFKSPIHQNN